VERALEAGVDELAHTPTDEMPRSLVERIVDAGVAVTSTVWTFVAGGEGAGAVANLRRLVEGGARLRYGTDVGNTGTRTGVEPRELRLLADAGLGAAGALRLVTTATIAVGEPAALVALDGDPLADPEAWRRVRAVVTGRRVTRLG
jgi:imidazolonepropionase-like amidohydrolase